MPMGGACIIELPVRFAETDAMGIVHHAAWVVWLEAGRIGWLQQAGAPYAEIAAGGRHFAVTGLQVTYRRAVRFGSTVQVVTRLTLARSRQVVFTYAVHERAGDGSLGPLLATARTEHVCVDLEGRPATMPPPLQTLLEVALAPSATMAQDVQSR